MLNKYYHSTGAAIGVVSAFGLGRTLAGHGFVQLISHRSFYSPMFVGIFTTLLVGWIIDRRRKKPINLWRAAYTAPCIFLLGCLGASIFNVFYNGRVFNPDYGFFKEIGDWFLKPMYWFVIVGTPLSVVIGCTYYGIRRMIQRGEII